MAKSMQADDFIKQGNDFALKGKTAQAADAYQSALKIEPDNVVGWGNLGVVQEQMGQDKEAEKSIRKAIDLAPDYGKGFYNLGMLLVKMGKPDKAIPYLEKAVELEPKRIEYVFNQGVNLQKLGKIKEQIDSFEKVSKLNPDYPEIYYWLWLAYRRIALWDKLEAIELMLQIGVEHDPFINVARSEDPADNLQVAQYASTKLQVKKTLPQRPRSTGKIRVGYFSHDLRDHPVGQMLSGVFGLHDRSKFTVLAFSTSPDDHSIIREEIKNSVDEFVDVSHKGLTDVQIAKKIYAKKIDILIEMTGHTKDNRFGVCAHRPARVQAEWLGFPGTTGASFMDYVLVDQVVSPPDHQKYFSEKLVYLPHCYQINTPSVISQKDTTRAEWGLPKTGFVFSSFNQVYKIDPVIWDTWMQILTKVPDSVLWLWSQHPECMPNLKREAEKRGVDPDRIVFSDSVKKGQHLARLKLADLGLDTLVYGGHTTTTDYLWAGVPVITRLGTHFASRVCASILTEVGLPELITNSLSEYQELAIKLASSPAQLKEYRAKITQDKLKTNLFNTQRFVHSLEKIYADWLL